MTPDENMKIYNGGGNPPMGEAEKSALAYLAHKENGNLEKCKLLGHHLANGFMKIGGQLNHTPNCHHKIVLVAFLMDLQLQHIFTDTILLKSVQSARNNTLDVQCPALIKILKDSTSALSLYMLDDRKGCLDATAQTYAHLCGDLTNAELLEEARSLTEQCNHLFYNMISTISATILPI